MNAARARTGPGSLTHKRASWLGVFALLMLFIGPLISQSLPMQHGIGGPMGAPMDMAMDMPMPAPMVMADHHAGNDSSLHPLWEKCGYCSLFFHTPALPPTPRFLAAARPLRSGGPIRPVQAGYARHAIFLGARTRAPPANSPA